MATKFETPSQFERDLRSANKEWKRGKDSAVKWHWGSEPLHGCHMDYATNRVMGGSEEQCAKTRPHKKASDVHSATWKSEHNITKFTRGNWNMPDGRVRSKMNAREEIDATSRSVSDLASMSPMKRSQSGADNVLYSFDRNDSPGRPLTLDIFVKPVTARDTERLVEKEYEILDENGQALKGQKARRNLRKSGSQLGEDEDEGFELV